jgi:2-(1,2-epoxy-1,2-dihydrophenyl)acetyl-CoA isomerase
VGSRVREPSRARRMMKPLLRQAADMSWEVEELAEPQCFTTAAHREAVAEMLAAGG